MIKSAGFTKHILSLLAVALFLAPAFAQAQAIGRIIQTSGLVTAVNATGTEREIARGSEIFVDETVTTGPRGNAKLRFTDGAVITLDVDSFFTVNTYEYDGAGGAADSMVMTIARGTMRTLTGTIGDDPADTYQLNTPFASIGVRGTEYAVAVDVTGRVRVFVFDGSIAVTPAAPGSVPTVVGLQGDTDAVDVSDAQSLTEVDADSADLPQAVRDAVNSLQAAPVSDAEVSRLPDPTIAIQVNRNNQAQQRRQQQQDQADEEPGAEDSAGATVDAQGRVQTASTETEFVQARTVVIISVSENDPDAFDQTTRDRASPN